MKPILIRFHHDLLNKAIIELDSAYNKQTLLFLHSDNKSDLRKSKFIDGSLRTIMATRGAPFPIDTTLKFQWLRLKQIGYFALQ